MFVAVAIVGAVLLLTSMIFDDLIDGLIPDLPFISGPVVGAFLAAFGLVGWYIDSGVDLPVLPALAGGAVGGVAIGAATWKLTDTLVHLPTDGTPTTQSLVGTNGRIVTPIRAGGTGEVLVTLGGASAKYTATADTDLATGTPVVVTAVESPTKVRVEAEAEFWA